MKTKTKTFSQGESYGDLVQFVIDQIVTKSIGEGPDTDEVIVRKYKITVMELSHEVDPNECKSEEDGICRLPEGSCNQCKK